MRLLVFAVLPLAAQTVGGPSLGYVVDSESRLRVILGVPAAAHIGASVAEGVRTAQGELILMRSGEARAGARTLAGRWAYLENGVLLSEDRRRALTEGPNGETWEVNLGAPAHRIAGSAGRIAAVLDGESVAAWNASGKEEFRLAASVWWHVALSPAGELFAFDPAARALLRIGPGGVETELQKVEEDVAVDAMAESGGWLVLADWRAKKLHAFSTATRTTKTWDAPDGAESLRALPGGGILLSSDPARPLWILQPSAEEPFAAIPAVADGGAN